MTTSQRTQDQIEALSDTVTETATLLDGESFVIETRGREMILIQARNVTSEGVIELESGPEEGDWWPNETLAFEEDGFEQIPWNGDNVFRVTAADGFSGEVRVTASY